MDKSENIKLFTTEKSATAAKAENFQQQRNQTGKQIKQKKSKAVITEKSATEETYYISINVSG